MAAATEQTAGPAARAGAWARDARVRSVALQALLVLAVVAGGWWLVSNAAANMAERGMSAGFGFLDVSAGFGIGFTLVPYREGDTYLRVFVVGIANTLLVAVVACALATLVGVLIGLARLSTNWVIATLARSYVELIRNTPLLLQIIAWYFGVFNLLPRPRDSVVLAKGVVLNNRGFYFPAPVPGDGFGLVLGALGLAVAGAVALKVWAGRRLDRTGRAFPALPVGAAAVVIVPLAVHLALGRPLAWDVPALQGFNYAGGLTVPPSFCALIVALTACTSCFVAEIVRSGIQSVPKGQIEAAGALNLRADWTLRRVVMPQAMRVIVPPMISQYLNVTKNSSLAIAIGFPDLVSVWMNTSLNQSGQAIPIVAMTMAFYCAVSLSVSLVLNAYNRRVQIKER